MPKNLTKPPLYRLTLTTAGVMAFVALMAKQKPPRIGIGVSRADGRMDVAISHSLLDQLQTASLPQENLSDTLVRIAR